MNIIRSEDTFSLNSDESGKNNVFLKKNTLERLLLPESNL